MEYVLYKLAAASEYSEAGSKPMMQGECTTFSPFSLRWFFRMFQAGGIEYVKVVLMAISNVAVRAASLNEISVWAYVGDDGRILHYSLVTPTAMHMPWLSRDAVGFEIGGCLTVPFARGKRIYPYVLRQIARWCGHERPLYMIVEDTNVASRAGMERVGFEAAYKLQRERRLGRPPIYNLRIDI